MKRSQTLQVLILISLTFLYACTSNKVTAPAQQLSKANLDSIKNDEINFPVAHQHLILRQRAVIRPIYVETEKNVAAKHKGYFIHIKLKNAATLTSYKALKLEITYFANNGAVLDKENIEINKLLKPNDTLTVAKKVKRYKNSSYQVKLLNPTAVTK